jgi:hypothetical protein
VRCLWIARSDKAVHEGFTAEKILDGIVHWFRLSGSTFSIWLHGNFIRCGPVQFPWELIPNQQQSTLELSQLSTVIVGPLYSTSSTVLTFFPFGAAAFAASSVANRRGCPFPPMSGLSLTNTSQRRMEARLSSGHTRLTTSPDANLDCFFFIVAPHG